MSNPAPRCSCIICHKECSSKGIHSHYLTSHTKEGNDRIRRASQLGTIGNIKLIPKNTLKRQKILELEIEKYKRSPKSCEECNSLLSYDKRFNKFCCHSCAAKSTNRNKIESGWTPSIEQRNKTSETLTGRLRNPPFTSIIFCKVCSKYHKGKQCKKTIIVPEIVGEFSKIHYCKCKSCDVKFIATSQKQLCLVCFPASSMLRAQYRFKFNLYDYPKLFDLNALTQIGFYAPKGKSGRWNPDGLSRDHRVSITDAINNKYDPFYITHPLNCELMPHTDNNSKKGKSSISYETLQLLIDEYESKSKSGTTWS